jgi:glutathione S-transferase
MAKMKLYYSPGSPFARKVRIVALETRLDKKIEMVNVALSPIAPNADVDKHNPVGKIPVLSVKGMDLFDSPVICEYLDNQHKGRKLLARKGRDRWVALRQQAMADGLLDAALLARYEGALRPEDKRWSDWNSGQMKKVAHVLDQLEAEAKSLKGKPTLGSISVACALGYLDFRFAANDWRSKHPKLAKWFNSFSKTPSVKATVPPPA